MPITPVRCESKGQQACARCNELQGIEDDGRVEQGQDRVIYGEVREKMTFCTV